MQNKFDVSDLHKLLGVVFNIAKSQIKDKMSLNQN